MAKVASQVASSRPVGLVVRIMFLSLYEMRAVGAPDIRALQCKSPRGPHFAMGSGRKYVLWCTCRIYRTEVEACLRGVIPDQETADRPDFLFRPSRESRLRRCAQRTPHAFGCALRARPARAHNRHPDCGSGRV